MQRLSRNYFLVRIFTLILGMLLFTQSCNLRNSDELTNEKDEEQLKLVLPVPVKVRRSFIGFSPITFTVDIDLINGILVYSQINKLDSKDNCGGMLDIKNEMELWKSQIGETEVCIKENTNPISDGAQNVMTNIYLSSTSLPTEINSKLEDDQISVMILQDFSQAIPGKQNFACNRAFSIDDLIKKSVSCIKI